MSIVAVFTLPNEPVETELPLTDVKSFIVPVVVRLVVDNVAVANVNHYRLIILHQFQQKELLLQLNHLL